ncbi:DMT family transporter [Ramlibacter sp. AW1]|uniref:DMT family transporter n=1 Tax=Ramlibacter aurantiacus TaxID=2801330 RepID=A0A937D638_9BURK|nr:DMT family transporter [Ramlibacter aurantiacus]MBL0419406.1 DMT family transporter [Ramlibacter aurantiacus]
MPPAPPRLIAYVCLAASMALVGSYVALSKPLVAVFPVMLLAWLRFGIGAVAMLHWLPKPPAEGPLQAATRRLLFLESFLGNFLFTILMLWGVMLAGAVSAGVIMGAIPAAVALLARAFLGERLDGRTWSGVACAGAAIALVAWARSGDGHAAEGDKAWLGHLLVVGAVLCEAAYAVIGKTLTRQLGPRRITALINLWGLALVTPFGLHAAIGFDFRAVPAPSWALLLFYGLAASVWSVWFWMNGLRHVPAAQAGVFTVMLPLAATAVGVLALGEAWGATDLLALALAALGVVLATLPQREAREAD